MTKYTPGNKKIQEIRSLGGERPYRYPSGRCYLRALLLFLERIRWWLNCLSHGKGILWTANPPPGDSQHKT